MATKPVIGQHHQTASQPATTTTPAKRGPVTGKKRAPENETPEQMFKRLGEPRVTKLLKTFKQIRNLARLNPPAEYKSKVFKAIENAYEQTRVAFDATSVKQDDGFTL